MTVSTSLSQFNAVLDTWENALNDYSEADFLKKPSEDSWSIGQVYNHLLRSTQFFHLKHAETCLENDDNASTWKKIPGLITYFKGSFPNMQIKVPASPQYTPRQPENIAAIRDNIPVLRNKMAEMAARLEQKPLKKGKTAHPAFGFLNAKEWFIMIEMHFRHHLRQKERLDKFLKG